MWIPSVQHWLQGTEISLIRRFLSVLSSWKNQNSKLKNTAWQGLNTFDKNGRHREVLEAALKCTHCFHWDFIGEILPSGQSKEGDGQGLSLWPWGGDGRWPLHFHSFPVPVWWQALKGRAWDESNCYKKSWLFKLIYLLIVYLFIVYLAIYLIFWTEELPGFYCLMGLILKPGVIWFGYS